MRRERAAVEAARCTLSLLHPDGAACRERRVGARLAGLGGAGRASRAHESREHDEPRTRESRDHEPRTHVPRDHEPGDTEPGGADIVWLAPDRAECRDPARLDAVVAAALDALAPDGVVYALAPPAWRRRIAARLRAAGLETGPPLLHLRGGAGHHRYLLPLGERELRLLVDGHLSARAGAVARRALRRPGWRAVAAELWPTVGIVARRAGARPPWRWLEPLAGCAAADGFVTVNGWRGPGDSVLVHLLAAGSVNEGHVGVLRVGVLKVERAGAAADEAAVLATVGEGARAAGAVVPRVLGTARACGARRVVLLESIPGAPAWRRLVAHPAEAPALLDALAAWLERWNVATRVAAPLAGPEAEAHLLAPLRQLAPLLHGGGEAYAAHLRALLAALGDEPVPRVAAHGDLTMHNVLLAGAAHDGPTHEQTALDGPAHARPGIVDWEAARADGWPLADLEYAAVDVALAAAGGRDRVAAWRRCFEGDGAKARALAAYRARAAARLGMPPAFVELCHHACWLHHAANEQSRGGSGGAHGPFLRIVRRLAASPGSAR